MASTLWIIFIVWVLISLGCCVGDMLTDNGIFGFILITSTIAMFYLPFIVII